MDLAVRLGRLRLPNPIMVASGTFRYAREMAGLVELAGTLVEILNSGFKRATVAEYRGPLGPNGARIYRILVLKRPSPLYMEVREDQLKVLG